MHNWLRDSNTIIMYGSDEINLEIEIMNILYTTETDKQYLELQSPPTCALYL